MRTRRRSGFTIVEILTVLVVLTLLVSMILPRLLRSRMQAYHSSCVQNVHNLGVALQVYANNNQATDPDSLEGLKDLLPAYMQSLPRCPSDESAYGYALGTGHRSYTLFCRGIHHDQLGDVEPGFPQFYSSGILEARGEP